MTRTSVSWRHGPGFECPPLLYTGPVTMTLLMQILRDARPILGGDRIEGVVIKDLTHLGPDRLMAKLVSDDFQESHLGEQRKLQKGDGGEGIVQSLALAVGTEARFRKMVRAMDEDGVLTKTSADIGELYRRVREDVIEEETDPPPRGARCLLGPAP